MGRRSTCFAFVIAVAASAVVAACGAVADPNVEAQLGDGGHADTAHQGDVEVVDSSTSDVGSDTHGSDSGFIDTGSGVDSTIDFDTAVVDTGTIFDSGIGVDTTPLDTGTKDTGLPDTGPPPTDGGTGVDIVFPQSTDTHVMVHDPYMWNTGDYVEGSRTTSLASATSLSGTFDVTNSLAAGGFIDIDVYLNSKKVGSFTFSNTSGSSVPISLSFAAVAGPTYDIKYLETNTVAPGAGSVTIDYDVAHITLK